MSTEFFRAREAGWTVEQLVGDAQYALRKGGVGLVVTRLRTLARSSPGARVIPLRKAPYRAPPTVYLTAEKAKARASLLRAIMGAETHLDPDAAEALMKALVKAQDDRPWP